MANEKQIKARFQQKHDIEANWNKALNFIPKIGEIIVYDIDDNYNYSRIKIGDGINNANVLPFAHSASMVVQNKAPTDTSVIWVDMDDDNMDEPISSGNFVSYDKQTLTESQKAQARANIGAMEKNNITLGIHTNGLLYIFVDGVPAGHGIELASGGISGYIAEDGTIVLTNLNDGEYTIAYEMNNGTLVTIGKPVVDNNVYYSVTKTLTQCTISNSATQVTEGSSYSATISANKNYEITSITVTMGGTDISSSAVSGGNITIANVTGNIVITAVAVEAGPAYTNQITKSKDENGNPYNGGQGWKTGYRLSGSSGAESAQTGTEVTGFIPVTYNDTIRIKNIVDDGTHVIGVYDSSHAKIATFGYSNLFNGLSDVMDGSLITLKFGSGNFIGSGMTSSNVAYIRLCADEITNDSIITISEEIA